jgi:hypothetical protein
MIMAIPAVRRWEGIAPLLMGGVVLTVIGMMVLLPSQGHGWGYRYIHPVVGNILILAGYGYRLAAANEKKLADRLVVLLAAGTLLVALPFLLWTTRSFVSPYAKLTELISNQKTDFVIVDTQSPSAAIDQVRNKADLTNRPLVFSSKNLSAAQAMTICQRGSVTLISRKEFDLTGFYPNQPHRATFNAIEKQLEGQGCMRPAT